MKKKPSMNQKRYDAIKALVDAGVRTMTIAKAMTTSSQTIKLVTQSETLDEYKQLQHDFHARNKPKETKPQEAPDSDRLEKMERDIESLQATLDQLVILLQAVKDARRETKRFW